MDVTQSQWQWQTKGTPWKGVGIYHVTVAAAIRNPRQSVFGELKWSVESEQVCAAHVEWSKMGYAIWTCIQNIPIRYPKIQICAATIMPDHVHMILYVTERMATSFNMVLRGWVQGCKKVAKECGLDSFEFAEKPFIRVMTYKGQLQTMAEYVKLNPYRMAVRLTFPDSFAIQRNVNIVGQNFAAVGNLHLLYEPHKWAVHVHKELVEAADRGNDQPLRDYKNECVIRARQGTILVGPFISPDEIAVREVAIREQLPIIYILDNGLPNQMTYKPAGKFISAVGAGRMLILSPWDTHVSTKCRCTRDECNAMNKMAEHIVTETILLSSK